MAMRNGILAFLLFVFMQSIPAFAQENITITTYYPSPYGSYNDMDVHRNLTVFNTAGGSGNVTLSANSGNLTLSGAGTWYQLNFADSGLPFTYLLPYNLAPAPTYCANGYVAVNYLKSDKTPINGTLPSSGYIVCLRGWE